MNQKEKSEANPSERQRRRRVEWKSRRMEEKRNDRKVERKKEKDGRGSSMSEWGIENTSKHEDKNKRKRMHLQGGLKNTPGALENMI